MSGKWDDPTMETTPELDTPYPFAREQSMANMRTQQQERNVDMAIAETLVRAIKERIGVVSAPENAERHIGIMERVRELLGAELHALRRDTSDEELVAAYQYLEEHGDQVDREEKLHDSSQQIVQAALRVLPCGNDSERLNVLQGAMKAVAEAASSSLDRKWLRESFDFYCYQAEA